MIKVTVLNEEGLRLKDNSIVKKGKTTELPKEVADVLIAKKVVELTKAAKADETKK